MFFEEMRSLPELYPSLRDTGVYMASMHPLLDWVITPLAMLMLKISPKHLLRPAGRMLWWGMQRLPGPPHQVLLKVDARGETGGSPAGYSATVCHTDGYELTAIPVAATLLQVLDGSARRPGLWMMGHLAEPVRLFADMQRMGVEFREAIIEG
jgi:saccharopine dehydrogenase (NAD+, L-lysine-forming)